jgi:hypothetical protein
VTAEPVETPSKKKTKFLDFNEDIPPTDTLINRPSTFALNKLKAFEYVELYYFTPEGCEEAANNLRTVLDKIFRLEKVNNTLLIRSISSSTASRNVIKDKDLTWRQMTMGFAAFLEHATYAKWPEKHLKALASLMYSLN